MTRQNAIDCLMDKELCKYCKCQSESCRKEAIDIAVKSMKAWDRVLHDILNHEDVCGADEILKVIDKRLKEVEA